ncbi:PadR family transcriptional regulator [Microlunatus parietis]|uniref:DNA-binding PadR family transcriptional regulator n=1 Tax=Microlunatus parietis TaxID=682979 RepID=A0A7Y9IAJ5_9ACTN|nr:PadR family transcriptional regulator [Microlunatus parietis]NYE72814.1 DNA-binding PadR family transcriptional regulator [Microlunatus parietis]
MSATRLLVLGAVIDREVAHGYQVRKDLAAWRVDLWGGIGQGSIYHALRRLAAEGLLESIDDETRSAGPARRRYRPTSRGRSAFVDLLERTLLSEENAPGETMAAIGFIDALTRPRAIELLEQRVDTYRAKRDRVAREYDQDPEAEWRHHLEAVRYWTQVADAEIGWTEQLLERLRAGHHELAETGPRSATRRRQQR